MCEFIPEYMVAHIVNNAPQSVARSFWQDYCKPITHMVKQTFSPTASEGGQGARFVYDAESKMSLPGKLVREEDSESSGDEEVDKAYVYTGETRDYLKEAFKRNSLDNRGNKLVASVKYGRKYANAFYNGRQIAFGQGDGVIFRPFTIIDVIGHEWAHGLTDHTAGLIYQGQSGALNEHFSDVFGMCIKHRNLNQKAKDANWIIGEGIFMPEINGQGIRNMIKPGTAFDDKNLGRDRQPDHMDRIYTGPEDNGGVHINSSIPNKIFAEYAINVGGYAFDKPAKIWYQVLATKLTASSNFQNMVDATQEVIIQNYGTGMEYKAFKEAAKSVGLVPRHPIFDQMK